MMGWCSKFYGTIPIAYEINSRLPANRLTLETIQQLGASFVQAFSAYVQSDAFKAIAPDIDKVRLQHIADRKHYLENKDDPDEPLNNYETVNLGY